MRKNQNGFGLLEILLIVAALIALIIVGLRAYNLHSARQSPPASGSPKVQMLAATEGTQDLTLVPGQTIVKLPSGARLMFGNGGGEHAVPDFVFGEQYVLGNNPNYLPIKKLVKTYHQGYQYTVTRKGCATKGVFDTDVVITVVTSCTVGLDVQKAPAPTVQRTSFTKLFSVTEKGAEGRSVLSTDPYLFLGAANRNRLSRTIDGKKVYLEHGPEKIDIITNFGSGSVEYTADELYTKQTKSVTVGAAKVDVSVALTCTPAYEPATGCHAGYNDNGAVYDKFDFTARYTPLGNGEAKILDYQE